MALQYTVAQTPERHLVYTNYVYLADDASNAALLTKRSGQTDTYVLVNNSIVYVARPHKAIGVGNIGLSTLQRETCGLSQGVPTSVVCWEQPRDGRADLVTLSLTLDLVGNKRTHVVAADLAPWLIKIFAGQVFTKGQIFCCDYNGWAFRFTVEYGEALIPEAEQEEKLRRMQESDAADDDGGAITQQVDRGVLHKGTEIELTAAVNKWLTFVPVARKPQLLNPKFKFSEMGIGGLDAEFGIILRRAFASRRVPQDVLHKFKLPHVKGMLLHGPPGTGKTLIARQIGRLLAVKEPTVVNGPELLNKYVGAGEENVRKLFKEAEEDQKANGDNAELHIIILDELDAVCKVRGRGGDSTGVHDTIVNQFLTMLDGTRQLNNILVIGMTNRKELIDPALLRPGRLEVHIEIGLPDEKGRLQIFQIQTQSMKENGLLAPDVDLKALAAQTRNFSGAEIEGVAKSAMSFVITELDDASSAKSAKAINITGQTRIVVHQHHFERAIGEVTPAFGVDEDVFKPFLRTPLINYGPEYERLMQKCTTFVRAAKTRPLFSVLLEGPEGSGKTSIAARLAVESHFPYAKLVTFKHLARLSESAKIDHLMKIFEDAYKSPLSVIILDSLEQLLNYAPVGPRFSNEVLQTLRFLIKDPPPHPHRHLLIIGTTSQAALLESLGLPQAFTKRHLVPALTHPRHVEAVLAADALPIANGPAGLREIASQCGLPLPMKVLLDAALEARAEVAEDGVITPALFLECLASDGHGHASSMHATLAAKNELKYYTSGAAAAARMGKHSADSDDDF